MNSKLSFPFTKSAVLLIACMALMIRPSSGQADQKIDSLMKIRSTGKEDTNQVNILNALSDELINKNEYDEAKLFADTSLILANKINFRKGIGKAYSILGVIYMDLGDYPEALKNSQASLKIAEEIGDKRKMAISYSNIGLIYEYQGNYSEAIRNHQAGLEIRKEIGDKGGMAGSYNNIGLVYDDQGNYDEALKNYLEALNIFKEIRNERGFATANNNIGIIYQRQGNYTEALKNYNASLTIREKLGDKPGIFDSYASIGDIYYLQKNYTDALTIYQDVLQIAEEIGDKRRVADTYECIGNTYKEQHYFTEASKNYKVSLDMREDMDDTGGIVESCTNLADLNITLHEYNKATKYLENALSISKEIGYIDGIKAVYLNLTKLDSVQGNFKNAFEHHKLYTIYKDSLFNETSSRQIAEMKEKYESGKKEAEIALLNNEKTIQSLDLIKQKQTKNYLLASIIVLAILSFFLYRNYQTRQQLKLQQLRNKIASDLHDDVGSTLSSISIFSQMAQQQTKEVIPMLETIGESSQKMLDAMADIVWTINPENDQFEKIILRMRNFAFELLGAKNIDFEFVADDDVAQMKLSMEVRKNLYLIFKEATNNMVKYAEANRALFTVKKEANHLTMLIRDNGKGFDQNRVKEGNGLTNMKKRAAEIGAQFLIDSQPGNGTTIHLKVAV